MTDTSFVLTLSCPDRTGIVYAVSKFLVEQNCNITDSAQFNDPKKKFFMRVAFTSLGGPIPIAKLHAAFTDVAQSFDMTWSLTDQSIAPRVLLMVSKFDHCLRDLLYRHSIGELHATLPAVISNHPDGRALVEAHGLPFLHMPVNAASKEQQEARVLEYVKAEKIELIVLARYMQILSDNFCAALPCPAINIHHSFLPGFKGAKPYHQAYARGVKLIGATAHYVTPDLDEGPIIEQDVARVSHARTPEELVALGRDIEKVVLARAVTLHLERRILRNEDKTIVFY